MSHEIGDRVSATQDIVFVDKTIDSGTEGGVVAVSNIGTSKSYRVRFDGDDQDRIVTGSQIESAGSKVVT